MKDEKACFSRVGKQFQHDYAVTFEDCQRVQNLREKLLRTIVVLDAHLEVANGCEMHCRTLASSKLGPMGLNLSSELDSHSAQLRTHRRNVANILERSKGTLDLVSQGNVHEPDGLGLIMRRSSLKFLNTVMTRVLQGMLLHCIKTLRS